MLRVAHVVRYVAAMALAIAAILARDTFVFNGVTFGRRAATVCIGQACDAVSAARETMLATICTHAIVIVLT